MDYFGKLVSQKLSQPLISKQILAICLEKYVLHIHTLQLTSKTNWKWGAKSIKCFPPFSMHVLSCLIWQYSGRGSQSSPPFWRSCRYFLHTNQGFQDRRINAKWYSLEIIFIMFSYIKISYSVLPFEQMQNKYILSPKKGVCKLLL